LSSSKFQCCISSITLSPALRHMALALVFRGSNTPIVMYDRRYHAVSWYLSLHRQQRIGVYCQGKERRRHTGVYNLHTHTQRRSAVGRVSDLQSRHSRGRGFESRPSTRRKNSGHVSHIYVPLFTKQYKLVPAKGR